MSADPSPERATGGNSAPGDRTRASADVGVVGLWERYKRSGDPDARERLILQYSPLVKYVAGRVSVGLPSSIEHADLVSYGLFGLIDAIEKFDLDKGVRFETYAVPRIKGAIIDELRSIDWVPRSVRTKARDIEKAVSTLETRLARSPTEAEIAEELGLGLDQLRQALTQTSLTSLVALDKPFAGDEGDGQTLMDTLADPNAPDPEAQLEDSEVRELLSEVMQHMGERERTVLGLYYFEGMTLAQVGEVLGVTESRVCQLHAKAVLGLRSRMLARMAG